MAAVGTVSAVTTVGTLVRGWLVNNVDLDLDVAKITDLSKVIGDSITRVTGNEGDSSGDPAKGPEKENFDAKAKAIVTLRLLVYDKS